MKRNHARVWIVLVALLAACAPSDKPAPSNPSGRVFPTPEGLVRDRHADFGFVFEDGSCYDEVLDTFNGTYTTLVQRPPSAPVTVPMQLADEQLQTVFDAMIELNFFGYPDVFAVPTPADGRMLLRWPPALYRISVRNGGAQKSVEWLDDVAGPVDRPAVQLRRLIRMIQQMIREHPSNRLVPPRGFACG